MRFATKLGLLACIVAPVLPTTARARKPNNDATAWIRKALAASDLQSKGAEGFRLQATVHLSLKKERERAGMLVNFWMPSGQWRREVFLPQYSSASGFDGQREWVKQPLTYVPYRIHLLWEPLHFAARLRWLLRGTSGSKRGGMREIPGVWSPKTVRLGKLHREKGGSLECVKVNATANVSRTFCFATSSGLLTVERDPVTEETYEYSDFSPFGGKKFPRTLRLLGPQGQALVEIHVATLDPLGATDTAGLFSPVSGARQVAAISRCAEYRHPKLIKRVIPRYPMGASALRIQGRVVLYVEIGTDGALHGMNVVATSSLLLVRPTVEAVKRWRYRPATCVEASGTKYRAIDTYITTYFTQRE